MQGRARGRKGERKTHHITSYHHITMEFGGYFLNVAKNPTRARARKGEAQGVLSYQKVTGIFDNPHICEKTYPGSIIVGHNAMLVFVQNAAFPLSIWSPFVEKEAIIFCKPLFCGFPKIDVPY